MARRNDHTREELIALTMEKVNAFLDAKPHHELSLRKIATMIGYVPSTLINVFGNYNLLLLEVVANTLDELAEEAKADVINATSPEEAIRILANCYLNYAKTNPYRWQLIFQHKMAGEELPEWQNKRINNLTGMLESQVAAMTGLTDKTEIETISRVLWAGVHGITLLSVDDKLFANSTVGGAELIDNLLDNYLARWRVNTDD
ncbi:TetR/AcrR family transcriptional regulator [Thaumasiovibrio subtropicus]|uniref:TetR/AcrR family transcriptional regulator n=1 Tax=Thaumasiovibrio subtropicus TaxID=1891207 RepID=UPI000B34D0C7|nr:TetR-like C-terminal domain-containing protein [Thaumasiovibrio subtropicus]